MILIFGIVAIVVFTIQVYKTANGMGRNGAVWGFVTAGIGMGLQYGLPFISGIAIAVGYLVSGTPMDSIESEIQGPAAVIGIISFVLSIAAMFLIWKFVGKVRDGSPADTAAPPPPPTF